MRSDVNESINIALLLDTYGELLSERQRQICSLFHEDDFSLGEIAQDLGITRQGVRAVLQKSEQLLRSYEESLALASREQSRRTSLAALRTEIDALAKDGRIEADAAEMLRRHIDGMM